KSEKAIDKLLKYISYKAKVIRDGKVIEVDTRNLVIGDVVIISVGDIVPADLLLISADDLYVNESILTGESYPVRKIGVSNKSNLASFNIKNIAFMGTNVTEGLGKGIVVATGKNTEFAKIATMLEVKVPESDFQKNIRKFGDFLLKIVLIGTFIIFLLNSLLGRDIFDSFLFALALAVGIVPESLPIIVTITLSNGALFLAKKKVVVKKLISIEDLGNMDVLCTDKTGTLTESRIKLQEFIDVDEQPNEDLVIYSLLCNSAILHKNKVTGNPIDVAIWEYAKIWKYPIKRIVSYEKIEEIPFDHKRKRMSTVVKQGGKYLLIAKGAPESVLEISKYALSKGKKQSINKCIEKIKRIYQDFSKRGYRVISVAIKEIEKKDDYSIKDEKDLIFLGFLVFIDPPKKTAREALFALHKLGVQVKILTGDSDLVAKEVASKVGLKVRDEEIILGHEIEKMNKEELRKVVEEKFIFARVTPEQKYRIILALHDNGHVVGYLGDGVNDAPALRAADVGISVDTGVDVAKDAADIIILKKSLMVIADGIAEGRKIFGNIMKYILNTISANIGNMTTVGIASVILNFIPLLPSQILLTNFLSDMPLLSISTDNVDEEELMRPKRMSIKLISKFSIIFGGISVLFDILTLGLLKYVFLVKEAMLRTGWFIESCLSEILITFAIRTRKKFYESKPSKILLYVSVIIAVLTVCIVYSPLNILFEFLPLPIHFLITIFIILLSYFLMAEVVKLYVYKKKII
ncbi:MAG: magnesium-translocating P-type ATPase, partial [Candidatus Nanoarchaeia archaeon]|nr:magnesium-translocating P-type ATPase [Candidatus Jingweiarchaeum tengchongense]